MTLARRKWTRVLHVAKRECALDDEAYRALLWGAAGVESSSDITTWKQYNDCLAAFKNLGFRVKSETSRGTELKRANADASPRNPAWITSRQEYYIRGLWDLASRAKDEASLRAMIKRIGGVDDIRFCKKADAQKVILALRDITKRAGYDPDEPPSE